MKDLRETVLDWVATGAAITGVLSAMSAFELIQRVAIRIGDHEHQRAVSGMAWGINLGAKLAGTRFRFEGVENVERGKSYIVVANHQSIFDIAMASQYLAALEPRYVSKKELARGLPGVSYNLRLGGSACIDRKNPEQAVAAIAELGRLMKERGFSVVIFPEGTRSRTGEMKPFRETGLRTLIRNAPGVDVLPVTNHGGSALWQHNLKPVVRNVELGMRVHRPVTPPDPDDAEAFTAFVRRCEDIIRSGLPRADQLGMWGASGKGRPREAEGEARPKVDAEGGPRAGAEAGSRTSAEVAPSPPA